MRALDVLATGPLALIQDQGRPGLAHLGVGPAGAADRAALALANHIVGNPPHAAGAEVVLGGLSVRARGPLVVAVTGAPAPARVDGVPVPHARLLALTEGQVLTLAEPGSQVRSYLAVRGGVAVPPVLGSRSRDTLADIGPRPLRAGDVLPVGTSRRHHPPSVIEGRPDRHPTGPTVLRAVAGPRDEWLADLADLSGTSWTVSTDSDRVGVRLDGPMLPRSRAFRDAELPSEGLVRGAVQVPPGGRPVIFGADHPLTGGYPVVAVVIDADTDAIAQLRPGRQLRIQLITQVQT